jgi:hypothetical protein
VFGRATSKSVNNPLATIIALFAAWAMSACAQVPLVRVLPADGVELRDPQSISVSSEGLLYVADTGHHRVIAVDSAGRLVAETGGFGTAHGQFEWPRTVIADCGNAVWVLDYGNRRIEKFTRSLQYQGTLEVTASDPESKHQPGAMALSPLGDLFVYDRDDQALIRYDPLFHPQAELGSGRGAQFVSQVAAMVFIPGRGLVWWARGDTVLRRTDAFLNPMASVIRVGPNEHVSLSARDSCLVWAGLAEVFISCRPQTDLDTVVNAESLRAAGAGSIVQIAVSSDGGLYILDDRGVVWRTPASE